MEIGDKGNVSVTLQLKLRIQSSWARLKKMAGTTGLEPATSAVTV